MSVPPARELRDLHKDLWLRLFTAAEIVQGLAIVELMRLKYNCRFGREESSTIKRLASVQERLKQQQVINGVA